MPIHVHVRVPVGYPTPRRGLGLTLGLELGLGLGTVDHALFWESAILHVHDPTFEVFASLGVALAEGQYSVPLFKDLALYMYTYK